jgi:predicted MPP superfamily phosphohydrolase
MDFSSLKRGGETLATRRIAAKITAFSRQKTVGIILLTLFYVLFVYGLVEPYWIEEKAIRWEAHDIPAQFDGAKIVFVSDIHYGLFFSKVRVRALVRRINRLHPDIILLGGDYVDKNPKYIRPCFAELRKLKAVFGVYGVLGNHDYWADPELTRRVMAETNILNLDNRAFYVMKRGARIKIGGVGDFTMATQDLNPTVEDVSKADFVILVTHNPDYVDELTTDKVDLVFSGHTHGGQVTLFGLWAPVVPSKYGAKYRTGIIKTPLTRVIVSNGIGTVNPPIRLFARPQINIVTLKRY